MNRLRLILKAVSAAAVALALAATTANADHWCASATVVDVAGVAYVVDDGFVCAVTGGCISGTVWIYLESNGEPGLQRGGVTLLGDSDICQNSANPDQGVF